MKPVIISIEQKKTGMRIRELMDKNNLKVTDVATACCLGSIQAVYKWRNGESIPCLENLLVLSEIFRESVNDIIIVKKE